MATAPINGFSMHYAVAGDGEPVVFVHGGFAGLGRALVVDAAPELSEWERDFARHFRFVTYDRRGCALSSTPDGGYDLENQALDLAGLLDHLGSFSAHVVGSSAGGLVALAFAARQPRRTRSLVLAGTGVGLLGPRHGRDLHRTVREQLELLEREGEAFAFEHRAGGADAWLEPLLMADEAAARGEAAAFWQRQKRLPEMAETLPRAERIRHYAAELRNLQAYVSCDGRDLARQVRAPTLLLHGDDDRAVPLALAEELAAILPCARLHVVAGGGHSLLWRDDAARRVAIDFLLQQEASSAQTST